MDNDLISKIKEYKEDMELFLVFDILTEKNTLNNYTKNSNGIFFNVKQIPEKLIKKLEEHIISYEKIKKENNMYNKDLEKVAKDIEQTKNKDIKLLDDILSKERFSSKIEYSSCEEEYYSDTDIQSTKSSISYY